MTAQETEHFYDREQLIRDGGQKLKTALTVLKNDADLLSMFEKYEPLGAIEPSNKGLAALVFTKYTTLSNWYADHRQGTLTSNAVGRFSDAATILGFAPRHEEILPYLKDVTGFGLLRAIDLWASSKSADPRALVWLAFCGVPDRNTEQVPKRCDDAFVENKRGLSATTFSTLFNEAYSDGHLAPGEPKTLLSSGRSYSEELRCFANSNESNFHILFPNNPFQIPKFCYDPTVELPGSSLKGQLFESNLSYFSRNLFNENHEDTLFQKLRTEKQIVEQISEPKAVGNLVVSGPGGLGKTRFSLELIKILKSEQQFHTIAVNPKANIDEIEEYLNRTLTNSSSVILVDYAETFNDLAELLMVLNDLRNSHENTLVSILICRASSASKIYDEFDNQGVLFHKESFGSAAYSSSQRAFENWVTNNILELCNLAYDSELLEICHGKPALASFAYYLTKTGHEDVVESIKSKSSIEELSKYIRKRIGAFLSANPEKNKTDAELNGFLAYLGLVLPFRRKLRKRIQRDPFEESVFSDLEEDGWLQKVDDNYEVTFDLFADQMILGHVVREDGVRESELSNLLIRATKTGLLGTALSSLVRAEYKLFKQLDWQFILSEIKDDAPEYLENAHDIVESPIISVGGKLQLIVNDMEFASSLIATRRGVNAFTRFVTYFSFRYTHRPLSNAAREKIEKLLADALETQDDAKFLNRAFSFAPSKWRSQMMTDIARYPTAITTGYQIEAMLLAGGNPETLDVSIEKWLSENSTKYVASFVIVPLLKNYGNVSKFAKHIKTWLNKFGAIENASYVLATALPREKELNLPISDRVLEWLKDNALTSSAAPLIRALASEGVVSIEELAPVADKWLEDSFNSVSPAASGAFYVVLQSDDYAERNHTKAVNWLKKNSALYGASHVLSMLISLRPKFSTEFEDFDIVDMTKSWLSQDFVFSPNGSFLLRAIISAQEENNLVSNRPPQDINTLLNVVETLLLKAYEWPEAGFVFMDWINADMPIERIWPAVKLWLIRFRDSPSVGYVLQAWVQSGHDTSEILPLMLDTIAETKAPSVRIRHLIPLIEIGFPFDDLLPQVVRSIHEMPVDFNVRVLIENWIRFGTDQDEVVSLAKVWLGDHGTKPEAVHILRAWVTRKLTVGPFEDEVARWVENNPSHPWAERLSNWLKVGELSLSQIKKEGIFSDKEVLDSEKTAYLLERDFKSGKRDPGLVSLAVDWAHIHERSKLPPFVFQTALQFTSSTNRHQRQLIIRATKRWLLLEGNIEHNTAHIAISTLLHENETVAETLAYLDQWLANKPYYPHAKETILLAAQKSQPGAINKHYQKWLVRRFHTLSTSEKIMASNLGYSLTD